MDGVITRVSCIHVLFVDTSSTFLSYLSLVLVHSQKLQSAMWLTRLCCVSTELYLLTSVVRRTDGYFLLRHFISISVTLQIGEQERGKVGETYTFHDIWWWSRKKRTLFLSWLGLFHSTQHKSSTQPSGLSMSCHELKKQAITCANLYMIHSHNIPAFYNTGCFSKSYRIFSPLSISACQCWY